jgi:hypothetical protein
VTFVELGTRGGAFISELRISLGIPYSPIQPAATSSFITSALSLPPPLMYKAIHPHKNRRTQLEFHAFTAIEMKKESRRLLRRLDIY